VSDPARFRPPLPPARAFVWAAAWLLTSVLSTIVLLSDAAAIFSFQITGQRSESFLISTPVVTFAIAVIMVIVGVRRVAPWNHYVGGTTAAQRQQLSDARLKDEIWGGPLAFALGLAALWLGGAIVVAVFFESLATRFTGLYLALWFLVVLAMGWVELLIIALRRRAASQRAARL